MDEPRPVETIENNTLLEWNVGNDKRAPRIGQVVIDGRRWRTKRHEPRPLSLPRASRCKPANLIVLFGRTVAA